MTCKEIASSFGCDFHLVHKVVKDLGFELPRGRIPKSFDKKEDKQILNALKQRAEAISKRKHESKKEDPKPVKKAEKAPEKKPAPKKAEKAPEKKPIPKKVEKAPEKKEKPATNKKAEPKPKKAKVEALDEEEEDELPWDIHEEEADEPDEDGAEDTEEDEDEEDEE